MKSHQEILLEYRRLIEKVTIAKQVKDFASDNDCSKHHKKIHDLDCRIEVLFWVLTNPTL